MKNQALFSSKDESKTLNCRLLQFLFGAVRVTFVGGGYHFVTIVYCQHSGTDMIRRQTSYSSEWAFMT